MIKKIIFNDDDYVNQAELARSLNPPVSKPYISKLVKNGVIVLNSDKKIKLLDAIKSIKNNSDPSRAYKKKENMKSNNIQIENKEINDINDGIRILNLDFNSFLKEIENLNFSDAKTKSEQMNLIVQKVKIEKDIGNLVLSENVKSNSYEIAKKLKESLLTIPDRLCDIFASENDGRIIHNMLTKEIKQTLSDIIDEMVKKYDKK